MGTNDEQSPAPAVPVTFSTGHTVYARPIPQHMISQWQADVLPRSAAFTDQRWYANVRGYMEDWLVVLLYMRPYIECEVDRDTMQPCVCADAPWRGAAFAKLYITPGTLRGLTRGV